MLQELKRKAVDKLIAQHIDQGKIYMGTSAGSLIMQKDIVAEENDDPKFGSDLNGDYSGLAFIDFYLYVHYGRHYWVMMKNCLTNIMLILTTLKLMTTKLLQSMG